MISALSYFGNSPDRSGPTLAVPRPPAEWHFAQPIPFGSKKSRSPAFASPSCDRANAQRVDRGRRGPGREQARRGPRHLHAERPGADPLPRGDQDAVGPLLEFDPHHVGVGGVGAAGVVVVMKDHRLVDGDDHRPARPDEQQGGAVGVGGDLGVAESVEVGRAVGVVAEPAPVARPPLEVVEHDAAGRGVGATVGPGDRPPLGAGVRAREVDRRLAEDHLGGRPRERADHLPGDDRTESREHALQGRRRGAAEPPRPRGLLQVARHAVADRHQRPCAARRTCGLRSWSADR